MRVIVSIEKCIASGSCALTCPQVFGQRDEDGVVRILQSRPPLELQTRLRQVVDLCPARVFHLEDEDGTGEIIVEEDTESV